MVKSGKIILMTLGVLFIGGLTGKIIGEKLGLDKDLVSFFVVVFIVMVLAIWFPKKRKVK